MWECIRLGLNQTNIVVCLQAIGKIDEEISTILWSSWFCSRGHYEKHRRGRASLARSEVGLWFCVQQLIAKKYARRISPIERCNLSRAHLRFASHALQHVLFDRLVPRMTGCQGKELNISIELMNVHQKCQSCGGCKKSCTSWWMVYLLLIPIFTVFHGCQ